MTTPDPDPVGRLVQQWRERAERAVEHGYEARQDRSRTYETCADELEAALAEGRRPATPQIDPDVILDICAGNCPHCGAWVDFAQEAAIDALPAPPEDH